MQNIYKTKANLHTSILDVGGGNGAWAHQLKQCGFENVRCVDKFCTKCEYDDVDFINGEIFDIRGKYDLITFHHSFKHIENPVDTLKMVRELLADDGLCLIRIPVCDCIAWQLFGKDWFQIDAPRHVFLYSKKSMNLVCKRAGLYIEKIICDSFPGQFYISSRYQRTDKSYAQIKKEATLLDRIRYMGKTFKANRSLEGDQAMFYIRKI